MADAGSGKFDPGARQKGKLSSPSGFTAGSSAFRWYLWLAYGTSALVWRTIGNLDFRFFLLVKTTEKYFERN